MQQGPSEQGGPHFTRRLGLQRINGLVQRFALRLVPEPHLWKNKGMQRHSAVAQESELRTGGQNPMAADPERKVGCLGGMHRERIRPGAERPSETWEGGIEFCLICCLIC